MKIKSFSCDVGVLKWFQQNVRPRKPTSAQKFSSDAKATIDTARGG